MDPKNELSEREKQLMALAWLCFNEKPKVRHSHTPNISKNQRTSAHPHYHRSTTRNSPASPA